MADETSLLVGLILISVWVVWSIVRDLSNPSPEEVIENDNYDWRDNG